MKKQLLQLSTNKLPAGAALLFDFEITKVIYNGN